MSGLLKTISCLAGSDTASETGPPKPKQRELPISPQSETSRTEFDTAIQILDKKSQQVLTELWENGQEHVFEDFPVLNPRHRRELAAQIMQLDQKTGSLVQHLQTARSLLDSSRRGINPLDGWKPSVPAGEMFQVGSPEWKETELIGRKELSKVGFVLVAGGLGERLGYSGIKIGLPTELASECCYLQFYCEYIIAIQQKYASDTDLPLCIMTSQDTHEPTIRLLADNDYFGMKKSQLWVVPQGQGVPALADNDAKMILQDGKILCKPHGHGDIHALLHEYDVAKDWLEKLGLEWLVMFQDTNGLAFHTLPLMLGVSKKLTLAMNSLAVPRKAKQAIGGIAKLTQKKTGKTRTINVEYNQLDPLLRATGHRDGDENNPKTGYSPFPGNINQLLFNLPVYAATLAETKGMMPEFVNPKYADKEKTIFKKPTRLECMMQDFPTVLPEQFAVGFTSVAADLCFSPVKNAVQDGVQLQANGTHPATAATGEADQYAAWRLLLRQHGCKIQVGDMQSFHDIQVTLGPAVILKPSFVTCPTELPLKFPYPDKIKISNRSVLIVRGNGVVIESLDLDGTLVVDCAYGETITVKDKVIHNAGWEFVSAPDSKDEITRMRGYKIVRRETHVLDIPQQTCNIM